MPFIGPPPVPYSGSDPADVTTTKTAGVSSFVSRGDHAHELAAGVVTAAKCAISAPTGGQVGGLTDANAGNMGVVPIGSVVAWLKSLTGTPALPSRWVEANGQTISDAESPYNGVAVPNLNASGGGTQRFLRGSTTSGSTGGEDTHTLTTNEMPSHNHTVALGTTGPLNVPIASTTAATTMNTGSTGGGAAHENRPPYYEVVWIIRIK